MDEVVHPCIIAGHDYGQLLYTLGVLGWLMLLTLPAGAFAFAIWVVALWFTGRNGANPELNMGRPMPRSPCIVGRAPACVHLV